VEVERGAGGKIGVSAIGGRLGLVTVSRLEDEIVAYLKEINV